MRREGLVAAVALFALIGCRPADSGGADHQPCPPYPLPPGAVVYYRHSGGIIGAYGALTAFADGHVEYTVDSRAPSRTVALPAATIAQVSADLAKTDASKEPGFCSSSDRVVYDGVAYAVAFRDASGVVHSFDIAPSGTSTKGVADAATIAERLEATVRAAITSSADAGAR